MFPQKGFKLSRCLIKLFLIIEKVEIKAVYFPAL